MDQSKGKLPPCQEVPLGAAPPENCECPGCKMRRAFDRLSARPRAPVVPVAPTTIPEAVAAGVAGNLTAEVVKKPVKKDAAVKEEESLRAGVDQYLLKDVRATAWDAVVGNAAARTVLTEAIEAPVKHADLYAFYGRKPPRGVLLHGAPGCGKTMLGRAAAGALARLYGADAPGTHWMLRINGPEIQTPYVGGTEKIIRDIFAYARAFRKRYGFPLVIFIDEADAILPARSGYGRQAAAWEQSQVAAFLTEMDGLEDTGALVLLATNRPDSIDEAVLRNGRIDLKVEVERPDRDACVQILENNLHDVPLHYAGNRAVKSYGFAGPLPAPHEFDRHRRVLVERAVDYMLSPVHVLETLQSDVGPLHLTLKNIVSGALVAGVAEQARGQAFRRDLAAGTRTGLTEQDLTSAVDELFTQNSALTHHDALRTLCEQSGAKVARRGPPEDEDALVFDSRPAPVKSKLN